MNPNEEKIYYIKDSLHAIEKTRHLITAHGKITPNMRHNFLVVLRDIEDALTAQLGAIPGDVIKTTDMMTQWENEQRRKFVDEWRKDE